MTEKSQVETSSLELQTVDEAYETDESSDMSEADHNDDEEALAKTAEVIREKVFGSLRISIDTKTEDGAGAIARVFWQGTDDQPNIRGGSVMTEAVCEETEETHPALGLYHQKIWIFGGNATIHHQNPTILDVEADAAYEGRYPGTVSVIGLGLESWDYRHNSSEKARPEDFTSETSLPSIDEAQAVGRLIEMKNSECLLDRTAEQERSDLREFSGDLYDTIEEQSDMARYSTGLAPICQLLDRHHAFTDLTGQDSIMNLWNQSKDCNVRLDFMRQIILAKELAVRLSVPDAQVPFDLTRRVLSSLIVQDLWLRHVELSLQEMEKKALSGNRRAACSSQDSEPGQRSGTTSNENLVAKSLVHQRQADGLVQFAKRIGWPHLSQLQQHVGGVYDQMRQDKAMIPCHVQDWFYGMVLPGRWAASKIMWALILCSPPTASWTESEDLVEHGLSFQDRSFWRSRTVLGRVLGGHHDAMSICGWVGPCPPVEIDPPLSKQERHGTPPVVQLLAKRTAPLSASTHQEKCESPADAKAFRYRELQPREGESTATFGADIRNTSRWTVLRPPAADSKTVSIKTIRLKRPDPGVAMLFDEPFGHPQLGWKPTIVFTCKAKSGLFKHHKTMAFSLHHNPIFVAPPPCRGGKGSNGEHEVHAREMGVYGALVLPIDQLKDHNGDVGNGKIVVINATARGAEVMARAWCSEKGKNAVVRRAGSGLCYSCAIRMASGHDGTGSGVLIWA